MPSLTERVDPRDPTGMRAVEARNIQEAQVGIDRAVGRLLKHIKEKGITDPLKIQKLVESELNAWGEVNKRLAIARVRDAARRGVLRSGTLLKALRIEPAQEQAFSLVERVVVPAYQAVAVDTQDSIVADLRKRLTAVLVQPEDDKGGLAVRVREEIAGPRARAATAASDETLGPFRQATIEVYRFNGLPTVTWYTERDAKVCDVCRLRHGKRYRLDRVPETHPHCRCALLPDKEDT